MRMIPLGAILVLALVASFEVIGVAARLASKKKRARHFDVTPLVAVEEDQLIDEETMESEHTKEEDEQELLGLFGAAMREALYSRAGFQEGIASEKSDKTGPEPKQPVGQNEVDGKNNDAMDVVDRVLIGENEDAQEGQDKYWSAFFGNTEESDLDDEDLEFWERMVVIRASLSNSF